MSKDIWFTSDLHFGHRNVIEYSSRPWETVEEMTKGLTERWNSRIKKDDSVYVLGDFCLTVKVDLINEWLDGLNGQIRFISGNHDQWTKRYSRLSIPNQDKIKWIKDYAERTFIVDGVKYKFVMSHFPFMSWNLSRHGSFMLHGHCHGDANSLNQGVRRLDVGVDGNNWYPWHLDEIVAKLKDQPVVYHHNRDEDHS